MSQTSDTRSSARFTETMTRPTREGVLASAHRLGGLVAEAGKSDAERSVRCPVEPRV